MNTPMKDTSLVDVDNPSRLIKIEGQWYTRIGPACWFFKTDVGFEEMTYPEAVEIEEKYQCLLAIKERRLLDRGPVCWYYIDKEDSWVPMALVGTRNCSQTTIK